MTPGLHIFDIFGGGVLRSASGGPDPRSLPRSNRGGYGCRVEAAPGRGISLRGADFWGLIVTSSFLLLVVNDHQPTSDGLQPNSFLLLIVMPLSLVSRTDQVGISGWVFYRTNRTGLDLQKFDFPFATCRPIVRSMGLKPQHAAYGDKEE